MGHYGFFGANKGQIPDLDVSIQHLTRGGGQWLLVLVLEQGTGN